MASKVRQIAKHDCDHDSIPKNISSHHPADDVSSSDEQIAQDTYGNSKCSKTDDIKPMDDVETVPAVEQAFDKGKSRKTEPEMVDNSIHAPPKSSSDSSSTLSSSPEEEPDPSLTIPVASEIFAAVAAPTEELLKCLSQKALLKNEVDSCFGSDTLYKGSSILAPEMIFESLSAFTQKLLFRNRLVLL
ncbi:hypothetical protein C1645_830460 [Glomus cerebriforme]|uniref:Uncharacterized protein n=1 Tax=Glomus cerebriforme TaxID=658196 RepID=A0A397SHJ8_9GLOM|nr:hypothetical protein C1645_830460 [Glomus cerebriforme]